MFYAPTFKRRAKGLIKAGRARWSDESETKICLLVSPAQILEEDNIMNNIYDNDGNVIAKEVFAGDLKADEPVGSELTLDYILSQMEKIRGDSAYIFEALNSVKEIKTHPPSTNRADDASAAQAEAIGDIVKSREKTNQKLLDMYEKMYDDLTPGNSNSEKEQMLKWAAEMSKNNSLFGQAFASEYGKMFREMFKV